MSHTLSYLPPTQRGTAGLREQISGTEAGNSGSADWASAALQQTGNRRLLCHCFSLTSRERHWTPRFHRAQVELITSVIQIQRYCYPVQHATTSVFLFYFMICSLCCWHFPWIGYHVRLLHLKFALLFSLWPPHYFMRSQKFGITILNVLTGAVCVYDLT